MCYGKYYNMIIVFVCKHNFDSMGVTDLECMAVNVTSPARTTVKMTHVTYKMGPVLHVNTDGPEYHVNQVRHTMISSLRRVNKQIDCVHVMQVGWGTIVQKVGSI